MGKTGSRSWREGVSYGSRVVDEVVGTYLARHDGLLLAGGCVIRFCSGGYSLSISCWFWENDIHCRSSQIDPHSVSGQRDRPTSSNIGSGQPGVTQARTRP